VFTGNTANSKQRTGTMKARKTTRGAWMRLRSRHALIAAMAAQHFTLKDVGLLAGCDSSMIGHLKTGHCETCTPALAVRIEKALRVPPGALFEPKFLKVKKPTVWTDA
jgi:hypothetical protein